MTSFVIYLSILYVVFVEYRGHSGVTAAKLPDYGNPLHSSTESKESAESEESEESKEKLSELHALVKPSKQVHDAPSLLYGAPPINPQVAPLQPLVIALPEITEAPLIPAAAYGTPVIGFNQLPAVPVPSPVVPDSPYEILVKSQPKLPVKPVIPIAPSPAYISPSPDSFVKPNTLDGPATSYATSLVGPSIFHVKPDASSPFIPENSYSAPAVQPPKQSAPIQSPATLVSSVPSPVLPESPYGKPVINQPEVPVKPEIPVAPSPTNISPPINSPDSFVKPETPVESLTSYRTHSEGLSVAPVKPEAPYPVIPENSYSAPPVKPPKQSGPIQSPAAPLPSLPSSVVPKSPYEKPGINQPELPVKPKIPVAPSPANISPPITSSDSFEKPVGPATSYGIPSVGPSAAPVKPDTLSPVIPENSYFAPPVQQLGPIQSPVAPVSSSVLSEYSSLNVDNLTPLEPISSPTAAVNPVPSPPIISPPGSSVWG